MTESEEENRREGTVKCILLFLFFLIVVSLVVLGYLFFIEISWGFKGLTLGLGLIFISICITFFKIILSQKYNLINPGGKELQGIIFLLVVSGLIIIFLSLLNLMKIIPFN